MIGRANICIGGRMISALPVNIYSEVTAGASPRPTIGLVRSYVVVMRDQSALTI